VKANQELQINEVDLGVIIINLYLQIYIWIRIKDSVYRQIGHFPFDDHECRWYSLDHRTDLDKKKYYVSSYLTCTRTYSNIENYRSVTQCDVKHILTSPIKTQGQFWRSWHTLSDTSITACPVRFAVILALYVSTFKTVVILYLILYAM
jgi:hypothetical protein